MKANAIANENAEVGMEICKSIGNRWDNIKWNLFFAVV
jgi:hypothetical protein